VIQDSAKYRSACTLCEFLTGLAYAIAASDGLNDRVDELIEPIRSARDWLWAVGKLMIETRPLPADFDASLDAAEAGALDALPKLKALVDETCDQLAGRVVHIHAKSALEEYERAFEAIAERQTLA